MNPFDLTRMIIAAVIAMIVGVFSIVKLFFKKNPITTKFITRTAVFAAISIVLYITPYLKFPIPVLFPSFLEIHFDEVPAFIAGFAYGPLSGFFVILIKTIVKFPMSTTGCVGELADLLYSVVFVIPAAIIYKHHRNIKGAIIGLGVGTICQLIVSSFFTSFVMLDFYMVVQKIPEEALLEMCQAVNPNVTSLSWPFLFMVALPFNAFKDALVIVLTLLLYKRLAKLINKIGQEKN
ncbi:MAG: ECF transporter S component [Bacilli bacterium]|nr:ECF transporter S component [Bacilli bacterium]